MDFKAVRKTSSCCLWCALVDKALGEWHLLVTTSIVCNTCSNIEFDLQVSE